MNGKDTKFDSHKNLQLFQLKAAPLISQKELKNRQILMRKVVKT
jgi:hypothetical protein